ncbi:MAG: hypothetical protein U0324_10550 [Polyangiales bacterium]
MTALSTPFAAASIPRSLALGLAGSAAFGLAAAVGHGARAMLHGLWMAPALFVGSALLATPPLYLVGVWSGQRLPAERVARHVADSLGGVGTVLLGLAAPAAYFSATLRTGSAWFLLAGAVVLVGVAAVRAVARNAFPRPSPAAVGWTLLALALGARTLLALAHTVTR